MSDLRTEEEQIALIKTWWKTNGVPTVIGIISALFMWLGWDAWQGHQMSQIEDAADLYNSISSIETVTNAGQIEKTAAIASQLRDKYAHSEYAVLATLQVVKNLVLNGGGDEASALLLWCINNVEDNNAELKTLLMLRLAKLQYFHSDFSGALSTIDSIKLPNSYASLLLELKGDIFMAKGNSVGSLEAYSKALDFIESTGLNDRRKDIEMKISNITDSSKPIAASVLGEDS